MNDDVNVSYPYGKALSKVGAPVADDIKRSSWNTGPQIESVLQMVPGDTKFGFSMTGGQDRSRFPRIDNVASNTPGDRAKLLVGDEILAVNGQSLEYLTHEEVYQKIHQCLQARVIKICVKRFQSSSNDVLKASSKLPVHRAAMSEEDSGIDAHSLHNNKSVEATHLPSKHSYNASSMLDDETSSITDIKVPAPYTSNVLNSESNHNPVVAKVPIDEDTNYLYNECPVDVPEYPPKSLPTVIPNLDYEDRRFGVHMPKNATPEEVRRRYEEEFNSKVLEKRQQEQEANRKRFSGVSHVAQPMDAGFYISNQQAIEEREVVASRQPIMSLNTVAPNSNLEDTSNLSSSNRAHPKFRYAEMEFLNSENARSLVNGTSSLSDSQSSKVLCENILYNQNFFSRLAIYNLLTRFATFPKNKKFGMLSVSNLSNTVYSLLESSKCAEVQELSHILSSPELISLLVACDTISSLEPMVTEAPVHPVPASMERKGAFKIVHIAKSSAPLGATVRNEGDTVVIGRIVKGGAAEKCGYIIEGDEVVEINGKSMRGLSVNTVCDLMADMTGVLSFTLKPNKNVNPAFGGAKDEDVTCNFKAMFDYDPMGDMYIPCKELGLPFFKGNILHVINIDDANWWQAYLGSNDSDTNLAGLIPSLSFQQQRENMKKSLTNEPSDIHMQKNSLICLKKKRVEKKEPALSSNEREEFQPYRRVELYMPREDRSRPIVLVGPTNAGKMELRQRLLNEESDSFAAAIPHTTKPAEVNEVQGREYYFVKKHQFEADVNDGKFIEFGQCDKWLYGTSIQAIRHVVHAGKTCVVNVHPQTIAKLLGTDLMPVFVFVGPPSLHVLRNLKQKAGEVVKEESLREMVVAAMTMQKEYGHFFDYVIVNEDLNSTYEYLLTVIYKLKHEPQWVWASWLHS